MDWKNFKPIGALFFLLPVLLGAGSSNASWKLERSEITYQVTHPLHVVTGNSIAARGEGIREKDGTFSFLVAVPVKSFESGDNNRDLHMQEVTKAGLYPLVTVRVKVARVKESLAPQTLLADMDIEFAGQKARHQQVPLQVLEWKKGSVHLTGTIPMTLKDFKITPPSLLALPVQNEVPVKLDMWWIGSNALP